MKNKTKVTIASITTLTILLTSCGLSLSRKSPYDSEQVIQNTTGYEQHNDYDNKYDNTILSTISDNKNVETNIDSYKEKLIQISKEKNFDKDSIDIINKVIDSLENNYDTFYEIYNNSNLPTKEDFINSFIENIENNIDKVVLVDPTDSSNEYSAILGEVQGRFLVSSNTMIINKNLTEESKILNFLHEECHSEQSYIFTSDECKNHNMYNIFVEGEAAWRTTLLNSSSCYPSNSLICIDGNNYYAKGTGASNYSIYSRYYKMLIDLAGYDVLQSCKTNFDYQLLINSIESRYNIDAEEFLTCISDVSSKIDLSNDSEDMRKFITAENIYLNCIKEDIEKADTEEEVLRVFNKYRYYKLQYSVNAYDANYNDITSQHFDIVDLETKLFNKINDFELLPEDKSKELFDLCLFNFPDIIPSKEELSLKNVLYYEENDKIYLTGKNNKEMKVYDCSTNSFEYILTDENIYDNCVSVVNISHQKIM